jgi:hypothetical protein
MKNITLAIDDDTLARSRDYAEKHGTTVNAIVRDHLNHLLLQEERIEEARRGLLELMDNSTARLGPNYKWNREELYADRLLPRHEHPRVRGGGKKG